MFIQTIISGLARGSIYSLIGLAYYIIYESTKMLNFAMGDFLMMGAMVGYTLYVLLEIPFVVVMLGSIVVAGILGLIIERLAIRPLKSTETIGYVMSTVGAGMILRNFGIKTWGAGEKYIPSVFGDGVVTILGGGVLPQELFNFCFSMIAMVAVLVTLKKSLLGKGLRAVALNRDTACLMGINAQRVVMFAFFLSSALAGLAGFLISPVTYASPHMGSIGIKGFSAAIIGGLHNPVGILFGGLLLGIIEFLFAGISASWREAGSFIFIIFVLAIRPSGLFSKKVDVSKV